MFNGAFRQQRYVISVRGKYWHNSPFPRLVHSQLKIELETTTSSQVCLETPRLLQLPSTADRGRILETFPTDWGIFSLSLSLSLVLLFEASWMFEFTARIMNNREIQFVGGGGRIDDRRSFRIEYCRVKTFCLRGWTEYFLFPFWNFTYILFFSGFVYYYCYYFFFFFEKKTKFLQLNLTLFFFFYFLILSLLDSVGCNLRW